LVEAVAPSPQAKPKSSGFTHANTTEAEVEDVRPAMQTFTRFYGFGAKPTADI
jgi:hypothetical protein